MKAGVILTWAPLLLLHCLGWPEARGAEITWTNLNGGFWNDSRNWNPNQVPGDADVAVIDRDGTYTIQLNADTTNAGFRLGALQGTQGIIITDFLTFAVNGPGVIGSNAFVSVPNGGKFRGSGAIDNYGVINMFGGDAMGTGLLSIRPGGELLLGGNILFTRPIENAGKMEWLYGQIAGLGAVTNLPSGEIDLEASGWSLSGNTLVNSGLIRQPSSVASISMTFNNWQNNGVVHVESGTLNVQGSLLHSGTISVDAGATCSLVTPVGFFGSGSTLTGYGTFAFPGDGNKTFAGTFDVDGTIAFDGGTVEISSGVTLTKGTLMIRGAAVNFNTGTLLSPGSLTMTAGVLAGNDSWKMYGQVLFSGGELRSPSMEILGEMTITSVLLSNGLLTSSLRATITGNLAMGGVSTFRTMPGATTDFRGTMSLSSAGGGAVQPRFDNQGLLNVAGSSTIGVFTTNNGVVVVTSGAQLTFALGGFHAGSYRLNGGWLLFYPQASTLFSDAASILGTGNVTFGNTTASSITFRGSLAVTGRVDVACNVNFRGDLLLDNSSVLISTQTGDFSTGHPLVARDLSIVGGALTGTDPITVNGPLTWTAGTIGGSGALIAKGAMTLNGQYLYLNGRTIHNLGTATWNKGFLFTGNGSVISNAASGVIDLAFDARTFVGFTGSRSFINSGLLRKSAGLDTAAITDPMLNLGTIEIRRGTLSVADFVQTQGATLLLGGNLASPQLIDIRGGLLAGAGAISASVLNGGQCAPGSSAGALRIVGDYTQTGSGALNIELGGTTAGTTYDQLNVSGMATLAGALNVSSINAYHPTPPASFRILTFTSRSGDFSMFNDTTGSELQRQYDATGLNLLATNMPPALTINREGDLLRLSWPASATAYQLQCASNVPSTNWVHVNTDTNSITVNPTEPHSFYRLIKP